MVRDFTPEDEGMDVFTTDDEKVGTIEKVKGNIAHVEPEQDLSRSLRRRLGWTDEGMSSYELSTEHVERIDDDGIYLKSNQ